VLEVLRSAGLNYGAADANEGHSGDLACAIRGKCNFWVQERRLLLFQW
jgi:hypothetical protein